MDIWTIFNSPLILTTLSLIWGSVVASWITALWQRRSHRHELKFQYAKEIIIAYQEYIRLLRSNNKMTKLDFNEVHTKIVLNAKIIGYLYQDKDTGETWVRIADKLSSLYDLNLKGRNQSFIEKRLVEIYSDSSIAIKLMFDELK